MVTFLWACLINERIEKSVKMFNHGFTYSGHPVGCAAALEVLKEIDRRSEWLLEHKQINGATRQYGCMGAIDFETPKQSLTFIKKMRERGYILEDVLKMFQRLYFVYLLSFKNTTILKSNKRMYLAAYPLQLPEIKEFSTLL